MFFKCLKDDMTYDTDYGSRRLNIGLNQINQNSYPHEFSFADEHHFLDFIGFNTKLANVTIPEHTRVNRIEEYGRVRYTSSRIILEETRPIYDIKTIKWMIENKILRKSDLYDFLNCASMNGKIEAVKYLNEEQSENVLPKEMALYLAAQNGHLDVVIYLIKCGANIHDDDDAAMRQAAHHGHLGVLKYLIKEGSDIHAVDDDALCFAAFYNCLDVVTYLVEHGANIHAQHDKALRFAMTHSFLELERYLLDNGADKNI